MFKTMRNSLVNELKQVKLITFILDGWTDEYCKVSFVKRGKWQIAFCGISKLYMLRYSLLVCHLAENTKNNNSVVNNIFFQNKIDQLKLYAAHNGVSNVIQTSDLLKFEKLRHFSHDFTKVHNALGETKLRSVVDWTIIKLYYNN